MALSRIAIALKSVASVAFIAAVIAKGCATHLVVPGACSPRADRRENGWIPHDWSLDWCLRWSRDREIGGLGVVVFA